MTVMATGPRSHKPLTERRRTTPAVDNRNRFTSTDFGYDKNGNLIQDKDPITNLTRQFAFNADNKQKEVISNGISVGSYFYDGEGKRVKKIVGNETTVFVYSAGKLVAEYSTTPPPEIGQINYTTTDHLGSPRIITNGLGQVQSRRDFMPFGEELQPNVGNRSANTEYTAGDQVRQKFTGYQKDDETQLDFAEARMYENRHGRFTAVDPLLASGKSANPQSFNRYSYVGNNPLLLVDRNGLIWGRSDDGRVRWFAKNLGKGFSEFRPDNWQYIGANNKLVTLDPNSRKYTMSDVPIRPGPVENPIPTFLSGGRQAVFDSGTGAAKGVGNFFIDTWNFATNAIVNSRGGVYFPGGTNPFAIQRYPVFSGTEARFSVGTELGLMFSPSAAAAPFSAGSSLSVVPAESYVTVFRVEGTGNQMLSIGANGNVSITGDRMLFLNFGNTQRAESFAARRIAQGYEGVEIKSFQVNSSFLDDIGASAVPESMASRFPSAPLRVDTGIPNQFGLRPCHFSVLCRNIVPGSGTSRVPGQ